MWLQQPPGQVAWTPHVISGPDDVGGTDFRVMTLPSTVTNKVANVFIVAGRLNGRMMAYWVEGRISEFRILLDVFQHKS